MRILTLLFFLCYSILGIFSQQVYLNTDNLRSQTSLYADLPRSLTVSNDESSSHVQGIAVDLINGYIYFSFTTKLIKTDLYGRIIGSVRGFSCHLGCLELDRNTGKLYASVEYKDDAIGQNISGSEALKRENTFYIGIFDTEKITTTNIDAETGGVFTTVYLPEVVSWYDNPTVNNGTQYDHVYGCSGVDGIAIGPQFGKTDGENFLCIALGIYKDTKRTDNDYQVLLQYRLADLGKYAQPLDQSTPHHSGPEKASNQYFVYTGNTNYGTQNLEYDPYTHHWFIAAYKGSKSTFPNYPLFAIDGTVAAQMQPLKGFVPQQNGLVLTLATDGICHTASGVYGWNQNVGSVGIESLGNGYFYIASQGSSNGLQVCTIKLYQWTGNTTNPFALAK